MRKFTDVLTTILQICLVIGGMVVIFGVIGFIGDMSGMKMSPGREMSTLNNAFVDIIIVIAIVGGIVASVIASALSFGVTLVHSASKQKEKDGYATPVSKAKLISGIAIVAITLIQLIKIFNP